MIHQPILDGKKICGQQQENNEYGGIGGFYGIKSPNDNDKCESGYSPCSSK